ncbi:MAG: cyanophycinase [Gemmatimonadales bacterium]
MTRDTPNSNPNRGFIIPIGGAEEKMGDPNILGRFVDLSGGRHARIAVIPTASQMDDTGERYEATFKELGAGRVRTLRFDTREDCEDPRLLKKLGQADGIFMTGGNQLRLSTTLGGTSVAKLIRMRNQEGVHVAGTSAGAAFMPEHMIAFGAEGPTPRADKVTLAPGLGLVNRVIVDQHFRQRGRIGRLLAALAYNPFAVGLGLDEDTAAFIGPDETLEVYGSDAITVVDTSEVEYTSMDSAHEDDAVCILGIKLHILTRGASFNLHTREAFAPAAVT